MSLVDAKHRDLATDPAGSFIVQAPAGSGKTEVLTQRYLRLLSTVQNPEEIICITFTKKAANEMRERILESLKAAAFKNMPTSIHKQKTFQYATDALLRSSMLHWNILENPNSLKVITIDSLCQRLANSIFIQESKTAFADICTNTQEIYQQAALDCLAYAAEDNFYKQDLENLLTHVDNRQENLLKLFTDLLSSRDTWLEQLLVAKRQDKSTFEKAINIIEKNAISNFLKCLDTSLQIELLELIKKLFFTIGKHEAELIKIESLARLNATAADELCSLLLTSTNNLRKAFDNHVGLKKGICPEYDYQFLKTQSKILFEKLDGIPNFIEFLTQIKNLPSPEYTEQQWKILQSVFNILPLLVAHLNVYFNQNNQVDFIGIANEALQALGDDLQPTDLALFLDNKIQHILIDEFQDTSLTQFQLLKKLTNGWQSNDGRTLFIVGDPQQSIYRFRGAEVGLFLKAKINGIGNLKLTELNLSCNFRSDGTIVDWVNNNFHHIFPNSDQISSGAIKYSPSNSVNPQKPESFIKAYEFKNAVQEAKFITDVILKELNANPKANIAILVRKRNQLATILEEIRANNIKYQGVDIDLLANQWWIRDTYCLTQALLMPGNRLAWLSFLRSPFCGINLKDILQIANFAPKKSILYAFTNLNLIKGLSHEGMIRTRFIYNILKHALDSRAQTDTVSWLKETINNLNIEHILTAEQELDLDQYWQLLQDSLSSGEIKNWQFFEEQLNSLYAKQSEVANLQIMTIHKSKGLEFDCVIIPGVGEKSSRNDNSLFQTLNLPDENGDDIFLFSPIKAAYEEQCKLYNYLKKIDEQKSNYELQRLLYVAITRAKTKLYITDNNNKSIIKNSFRSYLRHINFENFAIQDNSDNNINVPKQLLRLPETFYKDKIIHKEIYLSSQKFQIKDDTQRIIGIVMHEILQWICNNHPENFNDIPWSLPKNRLIELGILKSSLDVTIQYIKEKLHNLYNDEIGKWIISKHENEKNEYEILLKNNRQIQTKILDRTFVTNEVLWIIDFKTGLYSKISEKEYISQVNEYAKALSNLSKKIKCGLYFLENNYWLNWDFINTNITMTANLN